MTKEEKIKRRKKDNDFLHEIVKIHQDVYPELRYIQSLWALGIIDKNHEIIDRFYEEPYDTIIRIYPTIQALLLVMDNSKVSTWVKFKTYYIKSYLNDIKELSDE